VKLKPLDQRLVLAVALLFLVGFLLVVAFRGSFDGVNANVNSWAASINAGVFTGLAKVIAVILDTEPLLVISLVVAMVLFTWHYRRDGVLLLGAMVGDAFLVEITKTLVHSPRPVDMLVHETDYSFPSGHVAGSIVFFGVLTFLAWQHWNSSKARASTGGLYVAIAAAVDLDVLYLNVHWFSDVIGGCLLGAFWLTFLILLFRYWPSNQRFQSTSSVIPCTSPATSQKTPSK
jgi:undecaprenyl-diphosphatase